VWPGFVSGSLITKIPCDGDSVIFPKTVPQNRNSDPKSAKSLFGISENKSLALLDFGRKTPLSP